MKFKPALEPPSIFILEEMAERRVDRDEVCRLGGISRSELDAVLDDYRRITPQVAIGLERAFGVSSAFFANLDLAYRKGRR